MTDYLQVPGLPRPGELGFTFIVLYYTLFRTILLLSRLDPKRQRTIFCTKAITTGSRLFSLLLHVTCHNLCSAHTGINIGPSIPLFTVCCSGISIEVLSTHALDTVFSSKDACQDDRGRTFGLKLFLHDGAPEPQALVFSPFLCTPS